MTAPPLPPHFLVFGGPATPERAREFGQALTKALEETDHLRLDFAGLSEAHLSLLQLVCATHRAAAAQKKTVDWADPGPAVEDLAERVGFVRERGCLEGCLWAALGASP